MNINRIESGIAPARSKLIVETSNDTTSIGAYGDKTYTFTPPAGVTWQIKGLRIRVAEPAGGSSGTHSIMFKAGEVSLGEGRSVFGSIVYWANGRWSVADSAQYPTTEIAALYTLYNIKFDANTPLSIKYQNFTDVATTKDRDIDILFEEVSSA